MPHSEAKAAYGQGSILESEQRIVPDNASNDDASKSTEFLSTRRERRLTVLK